MPSWPALRGKVVAFRRREGVPCSSRSSKSEILVHWRERLGGNFFASPVYADGHLYLCSEEGRIFVVKAAPEFEQVAVNQLESGILASPAISGSRIYLRSNTHIYCVGETSNRKLN